MYVPTYSLSRDLATSHTTFTLSCTICTQGENMKLVPKELNFLKKIIETNKMSQIHKRVTRNVLE
jgi:hypothetical protein